MQPYTNPNYFQYNNPYTNYYNNMVNQQRMQQLEQYQMPTMIQTQAPTPAIGLNGKFVDSIENVKAADVMMDGSVMFFPNTDGKTIYTKQLQPDGTSKVITYMAAEVDKQEENNQNEIFLNAIGESLKAFKDDIYSGFDELNDRFDKMEKQLRTRAAKETDKQ